MLFNEIGYEKVKIEKCGSHLHLVGFQRKKKKTKTKKLEEHEIRI